MCACPTPAPAAFPHVAVKETVSVVLVCSFHLGLRVPTPSLIGDCALLDLCSLQLLFFQHFIVLKHFLSSFHNCLSNPPPELYHPQPLPFTARAQSGSAPSVRSPLAQERRKAHVPLCVCPCFCLTSLSGGWAETSRR